MRESNRLTSISKRGEVNGFTGLLGSGRSECVRAIFGADKVIRGTVKKNGKAVKITKPIDAMRQGIAYLPEDRKRDGIIGDLSVRDNIILALQVMKGFFRPFSKAEANKFAEEYIKLLSIKTASADTPIKSLSGGNQQKLVLSREVDKDPDLILACQPVRGLDIGAIKFIHNVLLELRNQGKAVLLISAELSDLFQLSDRIGVLYKGEMMSLQETEKYTTESISLLMAGKKGV